jgi:hypothetical protein
MREAPKIFLFKDQFFVQNIKFVVKYSKAGSSKKFFEKKIFLGCFFFVFFLLLGAPQPRGPAARSTLPAR